MSWTGKVAIVTGGASGIGAATVREFAARGVTVAILDINLAGAESVAAELRGGGHQIRTFCVDMADVAACRDAVASVTAEFGRLDILINNAFSFLAKGLDATPEDWDHSLRVNVRGYAMMVQACHPAMKKTGAGSIVNVASISGHIAQPNRWTYNACKGAVLTLTKCQALDLSADRIRVNTVSPGWIWTPEVIKAAGGDQKRWEPVWGRYHLLRRLGLPHEIAKPIVFLCSDDASFITGAELAVDGGYMAMGSEGLGEQSSFAGSA